RWFNHLRARPGAEPNETEQQLDHLHGERDERWSDPLDCVLAPAKVLAEPASARARRVAVDRRPEAGHLTTDFLELFLYRGSLGRILGGSPGLPEPILGLALRTH